MVKQVYIFDTTIPFIFGIIKILFNVPIGVSALCLGTMNSFWDISLYQISCRLPFLLIWQPFLGRIQHL